MARYKNIPSELRLPDLRGQDTVVAMERLHKVRVVALVGTSGWWAEVARTLCDTRLLATHLRAMGLDVQVSYVGVDRPRIVSWGAWGLNDRATDRRTGSSVRLQMGAEIPRLMREKCVLGERFRGRCGRPQWSNLRDQ